MDAAKSHGAKVGILGSWLDDFGLEDEEDATSWDKAAAVLAVVLPIAVLVGVLAMVSALGSGPAEISFPP